jgi:hypothetical protein
MIRTNQKYMDDLAEHLSGIGRGLQAVLPGGSPAMSPTADTLKARAAFIIKAIERAETNSYDLPYEEIGGDPPTEEGQ